MKNEAIKDLKNIANQIFAVNTLSASNPNDASVEQLENLLSKATELVLTSTKVSETVIPDTISNKKSFWKTLSNLLHNGELMSSYELITNSAYKEYVSRREVRAVLNAAGKANNELMVRDIFKNFSNILAK